MTKDTNQSPSPADMAWRNVAARNLDWLLTELEKLKAPQPPNPAETKE